MATSPIYSWPEPDNTDLVKNGALAIRTLGNAIDTTMATMVPKSIVDAKGDLIAGTAADTAARLAVGVNGTTLVADPSQSTGLGWVAKPSSSNPVLNSAMNIWQRGTSIAVNGAAVAYTADRWQIQTNTAGVNTTISRQGTADTTNLPFIQYCARVQRNSGVTANGFVSIQQYLETANSIPFAGKAVTVSFYARAGANFSASGSTLGFQLQTGTGTDQNNSTTGYTGLATPINSSATLTTTWQRFTFTGTLASTATEMGINIYYATSGTAGANDYFELTGVQIDVGSSALPFRTAGTTYQQELAACQRYYWRAGGQNAYQGFGLGYAKGTTTVQFPLVNPVTMRISPTSIDYSTLTAFDGTGFNAISAIASDGLYPNICRVAGTTTGATTYRPYELLSNNSTSGYIGFSAEL